VYIRGTNGYVLSLARPAESDLVELMVKDQLNFRTSRISAKLTKLSLQISIPEIFAAQLDGHSKYDVLLTQVEGNLSELHQALTAVFAGVGTYEHSL
jgi:hypothetical protein